MRGLILVLFYITIPQVWSACNYVPILQGIAVQQPLGNSNKKVIPGSTDCKSACDTETSFVCTAFLWPGYTGDCYLFDKVDVTKQIFRDNGEYKLYVSVCNNATAPTVGYCEFRINQTNVGYDNVATSLSPALTTQDSCFQFCINQYNGISYNAFIVKPTGLSKCALYPVVPTAQGTGEMNLWTKECRGPPVNCKYSEWSAFGTCSATCGGIRSKTRTILAEASTDGVPCLDSEKTQTEPCGVSCTATGLSTTTVATVSTSLSTSKPTTSGTTISGVTTLASTTSAPTTAVPTTTTLNPNAVETGCKIRNIDANSRPSSKNFRAVGNQPSCMARCKAETNFQCQAFITAGPKTSCLLFGTVDRSVMQVSDSLYYMQDLKCALGGKDDGTGNGTSSGSGGNGINVCTWKLTRQNVKGSSGPGDGSKTYYYTIDSDHCQSLCNMNHPMFSPQACSAWAFDGTPGFEKNAPNCYLWEPLSAAQISAFTNGTSNLYVKVC